METLQAFFEFFIDLFTAIGILVGSTGSSSFNVADLATVLTGVQNIANSVSSQTGN